MLFNSGSGSYEIETRPAEERVERIVGGDVDGPASAVALIDWNAAAFRFGSGFRICDHQKTAHTIKRLYNVELSLAF